MNTPHPTMAHINISLAARLALRPSTPSRLPSTGWFCHALGLLALLALAAPVAVEVQGAAPPPQPGPTIVVLNNNDSGPGSLRQAILDANPGHTILFAANVVGTITLASGELAVNKNLTILGPDPRTLAISGNQARRIFNVTAGTVTLAGLTLRDGFIGGPGGVFNVDAVGGGVFNAATLLISNCLITANTARGRDGAPGEDGALAVGGGIYNRGTLLVVNSALVQNRAQAGRGGNGLDGSPSTGRPGGYAWGGGLYSEGQSTLINCTFATNQASGGRGGDGGIEPLFGFQGEGGSGGEAVGGQLVHDSLSPGQIVHCTLVGGRADGGAGGQGEIGIGNGRPGLGLAGGVRSVRSAAALLNTLVASNALGPVADATRGPDVLGSFASLGHNLIAVTNGSSGWLGTDLTGSTTVPRDPKLGAFGLNLGTTPTYALQPDSPAVNAGDDASLGSPWFLATDQRGFPRRSAGPVDIGAYEWCHDETAFEVTTSADAMPGSLRAAIECLAPGGTITFAPSLADRLVLDRGELVIDKDLHIQGPGADRLSVASVSNRVFRVVSGRVHISGLTIGAGSSAGRSDDSTPAAGENGLPGGDGEGGGILNFGDLTLTDCMITRCTAGGGMGGTGGVNFAILPPGSGGTGGSARGGGVSNRGRLMLLRCTFTENRCYGGPGGFGGEDSDIRSTPGGLGGLGGLTSGGALYNAGTLLATNCTFATNLVSGGHGGRGGYGIPQGGNGGDGGAALGGAFCDEGTATLVSCTFSGNIAAAGSPGSGGTGSSSTGGKGTDGITVGGGIFSDHLTPHAYVRNTLIAGNTAPSGSDAIGGISSGGFNFIGTFGDGSIVTFNPFTESTDRVGMWPTILDPRLGPLDYNGGTTRVLPLLPGSPAIDQGHASGTATDQRGAPRPIDHPTIANAPSGDGSDIGAYENEPIPRLSIRVGSPGTVILSWPNPSFGYVLQHTANLNAPNGGWADVPTPPVVVGPNKEVTYPTTAGFGLFRLRQL